MDADHIDKAINLILIAPMIVGIASALAAMTPTPKDDKFLGKLRKALDVVALNVRHARNAEAGPKLRDK